MRKKLNIYTNKSFKIILKHSPHNASHHFTKTHNYTTPRVRLCLCVSLCVCVCFSFSFAVCHLVCVTVFVSLFLCLCVFERSLSVSEVLCVYMSVTECESLSDCVSVSVCVSVWLSASVPVCDLDFVSLYELVCVALSVCVCLCVCIFSSVGVLWTHMCMCVCVCVCVCGWDSVSVCECEFKPNFMWVLTIFCIFWSIFRSRYQKYNFAGINFQERQKIILKSKILKAPPATDFG